MTNHEKKSPLTSSLKTPLYNWHLQQNAKLVEFAGYQMPVQYEKGVLFEHKWTRENAGLFDVSHMGQAKLTGDCLKLEQLVCADLRQLKQGEQKYALLLNDQGGIMDDLMISRPEQDCLYLIVNAATKTKDFTYIKTYLKDSVSLEPLDDRALLALQGPKASCVLASFIPDIHQKIFMESWIAEIKGVQIGISRSGYTGEDGFELSVPALKAEQIANLLLESEYVSPIGLGARDSLRLEAGLCLYGHDIDENRTLVEASLNWALPKTRRERADFPGAEKILSQLAGDVKQKRVGIKLKERMPARENTIILAENGTKIGRVTSGSYGPSIEASIAMGYIDKTYAKIGTTIHLLIRNQLREAKIVKMPFLSHRYYRGN